MGSKGGFTLLTFLAILCALYDSGHSLKCYNCLNIIGECTAIQNCTPNFDACVFVQAETRTYRQCWSYNRCSFTDLSKSLGEKALEYKCCQKDLCNKSGGSSVTGNTVLLVTPLLAAFWRLLI